MTTKTDGKMDHLDKLMDPLGMIENYAKQLWEENGRSPSKSWHDYVPEAENLLLAGRSGPKIEHVNKTEAKPLPIPHSIIELRESSKDPLVAAVGRSVRSLLDEHESFCLGYFLMSNEFMLTEQKVASQLSDDTIAMLLAVLSAEYDSTFVNSHGGGLNSISPQEKANYWKSKIIEWRQTDRPLTYTDRNTIDRFKRDLCQQPEIVSLKLK